VIAVGGLAVAGCTGSNDQAASEEESLTWAEATQEVLDQSALETLQSVGKQPESIESKSDAEEAFRVVGWHQSAEDVANEQLQTLDSFLQQASNVQQTLVDVESMLSELAAFISEMKDTDVPLTGSNAWEVATGLSPTLAGFDVALDTSLNEVRTWLTMINDAISRVRQVTDTLTTVQNGAVENVDTLASQVNQAHSTINELESRTSDLRQQFTEYAQIMREAADIAGQLGPLGGDAKRVFGEASTQFDQVATELQQFNDQHRAVLSVLSDLQSSAQQFTAEQMEQAETLVK
jgi:ABC-type transporter Mla subunit MlaD